MEGFEMGRNFENLVHRVDDLQDIVSHNARAGNHNIDLFMAYKNFFQKKFKWAGSGLICCSVLFLILGIQDNRKTREIRDLRKRLEKLENRIDPDEID